MAFWRKKDDDVAAVLRKVGKRDPFRWVRQLDDAELERLADNVRTELVTCDSRDELLETAARLHYQTQPRLEGRLKRGEDVVDEEAARGRALAVIFERRYGVSLERALVEGIAIDPAAEEANLRVERVLRQLGLAYSVLDEGHWVFELDVTSVHVRHYVAASSLDATGARACGVAGCARSAARRRVDTGADRPCVRRHGVDGRHLRQLPAAAQ